MCIIAAADTDVASEYNVCVHHALTGDSTERIGRYVERIGEDAGDHAWCMGVGQ